MRWLALFGVGGLALWLLWPKSASSSVTLPGPAKPESPTPAKPPNPKTSTPPVQVHDTSTSLTTDEQLELDNGSNDLLYASGMVTPHKVYATAIANKLATLGDSRAADINYRIVSWNAAIAGAGMMADEAKIVASPAAFTLDSIASQASQSYHPLFVRWAAEFLRGNGRTEQADLLLAQLGS